MPYSITTKDGITVNNIPDDVPSDSQELKDRVARARSGDSAHAATEGVSRLESLSMGAADPIHGMAQLLEESLPRSIVEPVNRFGNWLSEQGIPIARVPETGVSGMVQEREKAYQAKRGEDAGFDPWRTGGNIATSMLVTRGLGAPATLGGRVAQGAALGGGMAASSPVTEGDFWPEKAGQVGTGVLFGGAVPGVLGGVARVVRPETSKQVSSLLKEGVTPTPGQILGGNWQIMEDKMTSLPLLGDAIRSARGKSLDEFNRAAYSAALKPIGGTVPKDVGREGVKSVRMQLNAAYEKLLPKIGFKMDDQFSSDLTSLRVMAKELPEQQAKQFETILQTHLYDKMTPQGLMSGKTLKEVQSELKRQASGYGKDASFDNRKLGSALSQVENLMRQSLVRSNPKYAKELSDINTGWANYARIRDAASRKGAIEGKFTPSQLTSAVRKEDKSFGKRAFSEGDALMQKLSEAGNVVLPSKYPDSGTIGRLALDAGVVGGGYLLSPASLMGAGLSTLPYLPGGRQTAAALLAKRPEAAGLIAQKIRAMSPMLAGSGGLLAAGQE